MGAEEKLKDLGIELPLPPQPIASYVPAVKVGNLIFVSGQLPIRNNRIAFQGKVYQQLLLNEAKEAVKLCIINCLSQIKSITGSLDKIKRIVKIVGYINAPQNFTEHSSLLNVASDLLVQIFDEKGKHSRVAIGCSSLPMDSPIEIEMIAEIEET